MPTAFAAAETFDSFLQQELKKDLLRFTTAGSVDDGKSTLIGRLLHDAKGVYEDQLASVKKCGHMGGKVLVPTQEAISKLTAARWPAKSSNESPLSAWIACLPVKVCQRRTMRST